MLTLAQTRCLYKRLFVPMLTYTCSNLFAAKHVCCAAIILALVAEKWNVRRKRKQTVWLQSRHQKRSESRHEREVNELKITSAADYKNYLRMDAASFSEILEMVTSPRVKNNKVMRDTPEQRRSNCLH